MANAVITGGLLFGYCKGYTTLKGAECPIDVQLQTAAVLGASKLLVDHAIQEDPVARAVATGTLFAGSMWGVFDDQSWFRWLALGTAASYISDLVLPAPKPKRVEEDEF